MRKGFGQKLKLIGDGNIQKSDFLWVESILQRLGEVWKDDFFDVKKVLVLDFRKNRVVPPPIVQNLIEESCTLFRRQKTKYDKLVKYGENVFLKIPKEKHEFARLPLSFQ